MIELIRELESVQLRQLIRVLDPRAALDDLDDDELLEDLVEVLRRELDGRKREDLPQLIRRRLVEVAVGDFDLVDTADLESDLDLATRLIDFILESCGSDDALREFEVFLRTKPRRDRSDWMVAAERARTLAADQAFDRAEARERAEFRQSGRVAAHEATAGAILSDLGDLAKPKRRGARRAASEAGKGAAAAGVSSVALASTGLAGAAAVAMPLSALAGGLYMAGKSRRSLAKSAAEGASGSRANRARRSRIVQTVVALSVYAVAAAASATSSQ